MCLCALVLATLSAALQPGLTSSFESAVHHGIQLHETGRHDESRRHFEKLLRSSPPLDPHHESIVLTWLGTAHFELRRWSDSRRVLTRAVDIRTQLWGERNSRDPVHARLLSSLGSAELMAGQPRLATAHFDAASAIFRSVPGQDAQFAAHLNNVALLHLTRKGYTDAARLLRDAVALWKKVAPPDDRRLAQARYNLAAVLSRLNLHAEADKYSREAIEGFRQKLQDEPVMAAELLTVRQAVFRKAKRGAEAKALQPMLNAFLQKAQLQHRVDVSSVPR